MNKPTDIAAISRAFGIAMLDDGSVIEVLHWLGLDGEDCEPEDAVVCVCGDDERGYYAVNLEAFEPVMVH